MADKDATDLIMKIETDRGSHVPAESLTELDLLKGDMTTGFKKKFMFEIDSFRFNAGVSGSDQDHADQTKAYDAQKKDYEGQYNRAMQSWQAGGRKGPQPEKQKPSMTKPTSGGNFEKWFKGEQATYPVDISPFEFTRPTDKSSPQLLQYCIDKKIHKSATIIKRKATGGKASGEVYLRLDFTDVLFTKIDWDFDDHPPKESLQFICRAVTISYRPQLPDGTLGAVVPAFWRAQPDLTQVMLKGD